MEMRRERHADILRQGEIIRLLHWQCWRDVPAGDAPGIDVSVAELVEVLPVLIESGSVGLVWPRLAHRAEELRAVGAAMQAGYEAQVAHNAAVEREIARVMELLREHDVEPVLIKGYAMARLYPSPLVRTAGDIDLAVLDAEYEAAKVTLADWRVSFHADAAARRAHATDGGARGSIEVDLHRYSTWYGAGVAEARFFAAATRVEVGGVPVLVPRVEDHLRALCLHFLRHGAVRPLRLCDIALLVTLGMEAGPEGSATLDWERVIAGTAREREQIVVTLRLAEALLGAPIPPLPGALPAHLPAWLVPAVLRQWGKNARAVPAVLTELLLSPRSLMHILKRRWPDPVTAVIVTRSSFSRSHIGGVQVAAFLRRTWKGLTRTIWYQWQESNLPKR